ncbi:hypothetical protein L2E82_36193 [Cichorium intybus]|uniref:Uncharacterized protein n=1 Tax=Cichorium intybus TaxID=13427 RepID=A0ACB9BR53_CICIN|nr:hypothetical protein L2E82_36193 [Cichorium intybus]
MMVAMMVDYSVDNGDHAYDGVEDDEWLMVVKRFYGFSHVSIRRRMVDYSVDNGDHAYDGVEDDEWLMVVKRFYGFSHVSIRIKQRSTIYRRERLAGDVIAIWRSRL